MSGLRARLLKWPEAAARRLPVRGSRALAGFFIVIGIVLPFFFQQTSGFLNATIIAIAYAVMSLGLNVVVGFAGLLDLGYVAFYALGAYSRDGSLPGSSSRRRSTCSSPRSRARCPAFTSTSSWY